LQPQEYLSFKVEKLKRIAASKKNSFDQYANDPVRFGAEVLGESFTDDIVAVMESVRDVPVTLAKSANGTGKTHAAARIAAWFYSAYDDAQVYTAAAPPENNLRNLLWGEMGSVADNHPEVFAGHTVKSLHIARSSQSFITGVTIPSSGTPAQREARFSGKHAPHILFIVDEGDAVPDEVYSGIESCMSGGFARLLVLFNPRHESGPLYRKERDGQANVIELSAFSHPNVVTGEEVFPGAVDREKTVRRICEWSRPLGPEERPNNECFLVPSFLEGHVATSLDGNRKYPPLPGGWRKITTPAMSYMVLAQYPAQSETQLISQSDIDAARSRWDAYVAQHGEVPPVGVQPIMGLDVAEFGVDANVAAFRYGGFVARMIPWSGVDTIATGARAIELYKQHNAQAAKVDGTGVGAGVAPQMSLSKCEATSVKVASSPTVRTDMGEFTHMRDQLWWAMREWLRTDTGAMIPPDEQLIEELRTPTYEIKTGKIKVMDKDTMKTLLKRSPDRAEALMLTFYGGGDAEVASLADIYNKIRQQ
jgi:hypothetical protein